MKKETKIKKKHSRKIDGDSLGQGLAYHKATLVCMREVRDVFGLSS